MSVEENKRVARRLFEEVWNQGKLNVIDEVVDGGHRSHGLGIEMPSGPGGVRQFVSIYRTAYPDTHFAIEDQIAEGDRVVTRWTASGTHRGDLMGIAPTGKRVSVAGITIDRVMGGKIMESWNNFDALGQLQQLGVIPMPGQGSR